jgi:hypothetical protein
MKRFFCLALLASPAIMAPPTRSPRVAVLDVLLENLISYRLDVADPAAFASAPGPVSPGPIRNFQEFVGIGDIVSVNGKPAKGIWTNRGHTLAFTPNAAPGLVAPVVSIHPYGARP